MSQTTISPPGKSLMRKSCMLKLATSAAHVNNNQLISSETFMWPGEHFKVALSQCKPEIPAERFLLD
ncbi:MAG: hypothetical protein GY790_04995 [Bacteroidetes bacterium]|nr:hypothetical protein [Bacteroidota bacterium]